MDWERAFQFWAAMDPGERSLARVAEEFGLHVSSVKTRSSREKWSARLAEIDARAREVANETLVKARAERIHETIVLVEKARRRYLEQLDSEGFVVSGHELAALLRVEALLEGEATDRVARPEIEAEIAEIVRVALQHMTLEQGRAFLGALRGEEPALPAADVEGEAVTVDEEGDEQ